MGVMQHSFWGGLPFFSFKMKGLVELEDSSQPPTSKTLHNAFLHSQRAKVIEEDPESLIAANITQSDLRIQCNPYENSNSILQ